MLTFTIVVDDDGGEQKGRSRSRGREVEVEVEVVMTIIITTTNPQAVFAIVGSNALLVFVLVYVFFGWVAGFGHGWLGLVGLLCEWFWHGWLDGWVWVWVIFQSYVPIMPCVFVFGYGLGMVGWISVLWFGFLGFVVWFGSDIPL